MVHTAKFYIAIHRGIRELLEESFNDSITLIQDKVKSEVDNVLSGVTVTFSKNNEFVGSVNIVIDFIKLLNKHNIKESDYGEMDYKMSQLMDILFGNHANEIEIIMTRIDYREDIVILDKKEREMYIKLYKKCRERFSFKKKYSQYDSSVYFNNKSVQVCIYDKEEERKAKGEEVQDYERDILRVELRLSNRHLSMKKRLQGIGKTLESYMNENLRDEYFEKHLSHIFFSGAYRKIGKVDEILKTSNLKAKDKEGIREFLVDVSCKGITGALEIKTKEGKVKYSTYTYKRYIKILNELNINPILIPKNSNVKATMRNLLVA